jgi:hypothetical protein
MQIAARRSTRSSLQIDAILEEFSSSGVFQSAFARQHGITQSFLSVRLKKARAQETLQPRHAVRSIEIEHSTVSVTDTPNPASVAANPGNNYVEKQR